jgi:putative ABC transport system substrate-binding protein
MNFKVLVLLVFCVLIPSFIYGKSYNIVLLETMSVPVVEEHSKAIQSELEKLSKQIDRPFDLEIMKGLGDRDYCIELLNSYLEVKKPDLVITIATLATQAAVQVFADTDVPILFCVVVDPVGSGIAKAVGVPSESNISGIVYTHQRDTKVEMVLRVLDESHQYQDIKFGVVGSDYPSAVGDLRELNLIAETYDYIEFVSHQFAYEPIGDHLTSLLQKFSIGVEELEDQVDFLWQAAGPMSEIEATSKILVNSDTPVILGNTPKAVELGALMCIATDSQETGIQIVEMVDLILKGRYVGTIPIGMPRKFNLHINMKTAEEMNIKIPSHMLMIAGDNIYR